MKNKLIVALLALGMTATAPAETLDDLLKQVKQLQQTESRSNLEREERFLADKSNQEKLLSEARAALAAEKKTRDQLKARFEENQGKLEELDTQLREQAGALDQLFAVVRQVAADLKADLNNSLVTAQYPERGAVLEQISSSSAFPTIQQLEDLWYTLQQEMTETGKVIRFPATIAMANGEPRDVQVLRVGPFTAVADGLYLRYLPETRQLMALSRQPGYQFAGLAEEMATDASGLLPIGIDPTRGSLLSMLLQTPTVMERIHQGGLIGYVILALGAIGLLIVLVRYAQLTITGSKVRNQLEDVSNVDTNNPLGRVLAAARGRLAQDMDTLQLLLDETIIREVPRLERGQSLIKLLAAVAPLLGLLGTVTGMIATFQSISLFGTGDPKLMASGISQALVTTMLGLVVAIPLLFLHSLIATRSRALVQILDEQSAGLIAKAQEQRG